MLSVSTAKVFGNKNKDISFLCVAGVTTAGRVRCVRSACHTQAVFMVPASSPGSATVRRTGEACYVIKVRS